MGVEVCHIIPWHDGVDDERLRLLHWVEHRLAFEGRRIRLADWPPSAPWSKPRAIRRALNAVDAEVVVIHDADVWCPGLDDAVAAVAHGYPWAVPHTRVHRLTPDATTAVLGGAEPERGMSCVRRPYRGTAGGGVLVMAAEVVRRIPPDPRFEWWGGEDAAWRDALRCLVGMEWRGTAPLFHLHHTPAVRNGRHHGSEANRALVARYAAARLDPAAMRDLIAEAEAVAA